MRWHPNNDFEDFHGVAQQTFFPKFC